MDGISVTSEDEKLGRIFTRAMKQACWNRAPTIAGRHPDRWRLDASGNPVSSALRGCLGCLCHEYDHIIPYSRGGTTSIENCQILQTRVNRLKGADMNDPERQKGYACAKRWSVEQMDLVEMAIYGDVRRDGLECRCRSVFEFEHALSVFARKKNPNKELPDCP